VLLGKRQPNPSTLAKLCVAVSSLRRVEREEAGQTKGFEEVRRHRKSMAVRHLASICDEIIAEDHVEHAVAPFGQSAPGKVNEPQATRQTAEWLLVQFADMDMTRKR
jgi:hypothetical protein